MDTTTKPSSTMRTDALEAYDIPAELLAVWRETIGPDLLAVQTRAVREFGLFSSADNLVVFAPTSSGKTFVAEMAAVLAARRGTKVFYGVPSKALADEKYRELKARYRPLDVTVVVSSGDHREYDDAIATGKFDIAVVVFEKLQVLLVRQPDLIDLVGLVVIDELQLITDEDRGPALELLLTKLRLAPGKPRLIGLSAVLGGADQLASWLRARLLVDTVRPVELRKGVLCRGEFRYREHNSGAEGVEPFAPADTKDENELLTAAAADIARRGEQVLMFVPDRKTTTALAAKLAACLGLAPATEAMAEMGAEEETETQGALRQVLAGAVAFHNSDLSAEERGIVERHFRGGAIRVLVSTTTLAVGLNLPTKNVLIDGRRWKYKKRYGRHSLVDMTKSEYENMSGRAGRLAFANEFGRSILVTWSRWHRDVWMRNFVAANFEPVRPMLKEAPLEDHVLNLLTSGLADSRPELADLLLESFTGFVHWRNAMSREEFAATLEKAVATCVEGGLLREEANGRFTVTEVGKACAAKGIDVQTGIGLARWAAAARDRRVIGIEVLVKIGRTPAGEDSHVPLSRDEKFDIDYRRLLFDRIRMDQVIDRHLFEWIANPKIAIEFADARAVKKALMLIEWIHETPTPQIERMYPTTSGMIRRVASDYSRLVEGLGAIAAASGWRKELCRVFDALAERLIHGVEADALALARMRVRSLRRSHLRRLVGAGFTSEEALRAADPDVVRALLDHEVASTSLMAHLGSPAPAAEPASERGSEPPAATSASGVDVALPSDVEPAALGTNGHTTAFSAPTDPDGVSVFVDARQRRLICFGREIPSKPPHHIQRQPLLAMACLGMKPGSVFTMRDIAKFVGKTLGCKEPPPVTDARRLRFKMLAPLRKRLPPELHPTVDRMVEVVGSGLRLNAPGIVKVVQTDPAAAAS